MSDKKAEQRINIKFLAKLDKPAMEIACLVRVFLNQRSPPLFVDKKCKGENDTSQSASQKMVCRNRFER